MIAVQNQYIQSYELQIWQACSQRQFGHDPLKIFRKGGVARVTWPLNFWKISANYSNTVKATDCKFGRHVPRDSPHMTLKNFRKGGVVIGSTNPYIFWALNANCSNTAKDTDFKFDKHVPRDSPDMSPKFCRKWAWLCRNFWTLNCTCFTIYGGYLDPGHAPFSKNILRIISPKEHACQIWSP